MQNTRNRIEQFQPSPYLAKGTMRKLKQEFVQGRPLNPTAQQFWLGSRAAFRWNGMKEGLWGSKLSIELARCNNFYKTYTNKLSFKI